MNHLRSRWALLREASFLTPPHDRLYPSVWGPDEHMRPEAHDAIMGAFLAVVQPVFPDILDWTRYATIGSGASYNWAEAGDLDIQVWVQDPARVGDVRRLIARNLLGVTCADLGLVTIDCDGLMGVQWFAKAGQGTEPENLAGQPYACYDMDQREWLVKPFPLTPQMYGDLFLLVEPRAEEVATEAEALLSRFDRAKADVAYWLGLSAMGGYEERAALAKERLREAQSEVRALLGTLKSSRSDAYTETGKGIFDERDAIWKMLEVWGIKQRLMAVASESVA